MYEKSNGRTVQDDLANSGTMDIFARISANKVCFRYKSEVQKIYGEKIRATRVYLKNGFVTNRAEHTQRCIYARV